MLFIIATVLFFGAPPAPDAFPERHLEPYEVSHPIRQEQFDQISGYLQRQIAASEEHRAAFFQPDYSSEAAYRESLPPYRAQIEARIGYPPSGVKEGTALRVEPVGEDGYAKIYRVCLEVLEGVELYSILWVPKGLTQPAPLLICQHGGGGSPEVIGMFQGEKGLGISNYGWMVQRGLEQGYVCWAPALIIRLGGKEEINGPDRIPLDTSLRNIGTSILAIETFKIRRGLTEILKRPEVDSERVAMMGLSYGGLYTLFLAAMEPRIDVAVSSCYFNRREDYAWADWSFFNYFNEFTDAELAGLVCPRPLMIEVGEADTLFMVEGARATAPAAARHWEQLQVAGHFKFSVFPGGHEFWGDGAYEFVAAHLRR